MFAETDDERPVNGLRGEQFPYHRVGGRATGAALGREEFNEDGDSRLGHLDGGVRAGADAGEGGHHRQDRDEAMAQWHTWIFARAGSAVTVT